MTLHPTNMQNQMTLKDIVFAIGQSGLFNRFSTNIDGESAPQYITLWVEKEKKKSACDTLRYTLGHDLPLSRIHVVVVGSILMDLWLQLLVSVSCVLKWISVLKY